MKIRNDWFGLIRDIPVESKYLKGVLANR
ncbi:hypothetical protein MNBD_ALPHA05-2162, partial [hydrothermal vent metagenome]